MCFWREAPSSWTAGDPACGPDGGRVRCFACEVFECARWWPPPFARMASTTNRLHIRRPLAKADNLPTSPEKQSVFFFSTSPARGQMGLVLRHWHHALASMFPEGTVATGLNDNARPPS